MRNRRSMRRKRREKKKLEQEEERGEEGEAKSQETEEEEGNQKERKMQIMRFPSESLFSPCSLFPPYLPSDSLPVGYDIILVFFTLRKRKWICLPQRVKGK
jgi:hypothetical protein